MRADGASRVDLLDWHCKRLRRSARALGFHYPGDDAIREAVATRLAMHLAATGSRRVRLLLSADGGLSITVAPLPELAPMQRVAPATTTLPSGSPWLHHKTTHRPWYDNAMSWLEAHPGVFDLIYCNERGEICEGSRSNVYAHLAGRWVTPPLTCGLLDGVQRQQLMATEPIEEQILHFEDLKKAQALRLSNALRGWFDVQLDLTLQG